MVRQHPLLEHANSFPSTDWSPLPTHVFSRNRLTGYEMGCLRIVFLQVCVPQTRPGIFQIPQIARLWRAIVERRGGQ